MAPPKRTDGAEYGVNSKESEFGFAGPYRFFFIHPLLPAEFCRACRTLPISLKKSFFFANAY